MITYGNGNVLSGIENIQAFQINYKGAVEINPSQDNWVISANNNKIIGVNLSKTCTPLLFTYIGEFKILKYQYVKDGDIHYSRGKTDTPFIKVVGVDYWELDEEVWQTDNSLWGDSNKNYISGRKIIKTSIKNLENGVSKVTKKEI